MRAGNKKLAEVRITLYGFRAEENEIEADFRNFFTSLHKINCRVFSINLPDAKVINLMADNTTDMDYITLKCDDAKVLDRIKKAIAVNPNLSRHFIDFQKVSLSSSR